VSKTLGRSLPILLFPSLRKYSIHFLFPQLSNLHLLGLEAVPGFRRAPLNFGQTLIDFPLGCCDPGQIGFIILPGAVGVSDQGGIAPAFGLQELGIVPQENPNLLRVPVLDSAGMDLLSGEPFLDLIFGLGQEPIPVLSLDHLPGRVQGQFPGEKKKGAVLLDGPAAPDNIPHKHTWQKIMPRRQGPLYPYSQGNPLSEGIFGRQDQMVIFLSLPGHGRARNNFPFLSLGCFLPDGAGFLGLLSRGRGKAIRKGGPEGPHFLTLDLSS